MADLPEDLRQGAIVWVVPRDRRGGGKRRPVVVITRDDEIGPGATLVGVAITSTIVEPVSEMHVDLPWDSRGHRFTGLKRRSLAVCDWLVSFTNADVESVEGLVPRFQLARILELVARLGS